jgi:hypothetical protein
VRIMIDEFLCRHTRELMLFDACRRGCVPVHRDRVCCIFPFIGGTHQGIYFWMKGRNIRRLQTNNVLTGDLTPMPTNTDV